MRLRAIASVALLLVISLPAHARLGDDESSLDATRVMLEPGAEKVTTHGTHVVHEFAVGSGIVRAYLSPSGQVFAYTAHGLRSHPDPSLFGEYLNEYREAARAFRKHGRRPLSLQTPNLSISIAGPQSRLHWVLSLTTLPPGVTTDDIR